MTAKNNGNNWDGIERRACIDHRAHEVLFIDMGKRIDNLENLKPVPFMSFKWAISLIITTVVSLFSLSIVSSNTAIKKLHNIEVVQERLINKTQKIQEDVHELKTYTREEVNMMKRRSATREEIVKEILEDIRIHHK